MTITREEFDAALASVRELKDKMDQNAADLKIQFERIAQMQAELDCMRLASERRSRRKKSAEAPLATAADSSNAGGVRPR